MKVRFVKNARNAKDKGKDFVINSVHELSNERAESAIKRGLAIEVETEKEPTKSTQEKKAKKTIKK
jgi:hypothetical protein